jgi:hypothetical protein
MKGYISDPEKPTWWAQGVAEAPDVEIQAGLILLSYAPVSEYRGFTENEVRLVAKYRRTFPLGANDPVWKAIYTAQTEAWVYAIHESAELQAFADMEVNPFDVKLRIAYLAEAHLRATIAELHYLQIWAAQLKLTTSEMALEESNPLRNWTRQHRHQLIDLQIRTGWPQPTAAELQDALSFWRQILGGIS